MSKPLSQQLSELSVRAKNAEAAAATAQNAAREKAAALRDEARAALSAATDKVRQEVNTAKDQTSRDWTALQLKLKADADSLKAAVAAKKHEIDADRAEDAAEGLEREASVAIDYAIASIERAKYAVIDAIVGRIEAEQARV
jgi:hypothetical protein